MSLRLEMLQVSRLAPRLLGESTELVEAFVRDQLHPSGGFVDRAGMPDLYYTVFGLECGLSLGVAMPSEAIGRFLTDFGGGGELDLVHLSCLARCWDALPGVRPPDEIRRQIGKRLKMFRSADGAYGGLPAAAEGDVYACFMALETSQDLGVPLAGAEDVARLVTSRMATDGGFANDRHLPVGTLPVTAAAVTLLRHLGRPVAESTAAWLADQWHPEGGFRPTPAAPMPDLLSTATAVHAMAGLQHPALDDLVDPCLDYLDTLWTNRGAFHGHWADDEVDCEYTFYGLLTLGHLSILRR